MSANVLIIVPQKPGLNPILRDKGVELAERAKATSQGLDIDILIDHKAQPSEPGDVRPWSKVTRVRNRILESLDISKYSHLLWIDADVVEYPADMPSSLYNLNPDGVMAPMVLIEGGVQFYDWAAFIYNGHDHKQPDNRWQVKGRNIETMPPYGIWDKDIVDMACVGTVTLVNTDIYRTGVKYEDHPAFTDHYPICKKAAEMGRLVGVARHVYAYHADLPKYGEAWH